MDEVKTNIFGTKIDKKVVSFYDLLDDYFIDSPTPLRQGDIEETILYMI